MKTANLLKEVKKEIKKLQKIAKLLGDGSKDSTVASTRKPMSEEGKAKIAAAQKARWAKAKKET